MVNCIGHAEVNPIRMLSEASLLSCFLNDFGGNGTNGLEFVTINLDIHYAASNRREPAACNSASSSAQRCVKRSISTWAVISACLESS
ncbi:MAG: hypothetical protein [Caudoviricetes sp.]|nr:MAG: hypothetical protein [Caudoviricetes sp.]